MWTKNDKNRWQATINGRVFILVRNTKTHTRTEHNPRFVCIGRKPRYSTTTTWYYVLERMPDGTLAQHHKFETLPGSLVEAKALAHQIAGDNQ